MGLMHCENLSVRDAAPTGNVKASFLDWFSLVQDLLKVAVPIITIIG